MVVERYIVLYTEKQPCYKVELFVFIKKSLCIAESFNTNILHQRLDYAITFANLKGDFVLKNRFRMFILKISGIQK